MNFLYFINNNLKKIKNKFYIIFFLLIKKRNHPKLAY